MDFLERRLSFNRLDSLVTTVPTYPHDSAGSLATSFTVSSQDDIHFSINQKVRAHLESILFHQLTILANFFSILHSHLKRKFRLLFENT
ncbi:unnamed protein product [Rhizophagus irregularis]|nr:unnamed protein product [Rhizophagus irregularis]